MMQSEVNFDDYGVLIVDDNAANLGVIADYLEDCGFDVLVATDGEKGIMRAEFAMPGLILLDVMMPGIDGFETCRRLKANEKTKDIPVIFMTALTSTRDKVRGFEAGGVDYITKPIQHEEVLARVRTHLRIRYLTGKLQEQNKEIIALNECLKDENIRMSAEMEIARRIQTVMLPKKPEITGYEIAASCEPAEEVGGDYYDVISVGGFDWIVIGDVSGHGLTSGLVMMMVQTAIHTVLIEDPKIPPSAMLSVINKIIYNNINLMDESKHMTIIVLATGKEGRFSFSGLHEDILIRRAKTGKVEIVESEGMWIGIEPDITELLSDDTLQLDSRDCMVLFTDGITEAICERGELFGDERLIKIIEEAGDISASQIRKNITDALESCEKPDDVTLFVMKRV